MEVDSLLIAIKDKIPKPPYNLSTNVFILPFVNPSLNRTLLNAVLAQADHLAAARLVAPDALNKNAVLRQLDKHALT